jgi:hypothetical protein
MNCWQWRLWTANIDGYELLTVAVINCWQWRLPRAIIAAIWNDQKHRRNRILSANNCRRLKLGTESAEQRVLHSWVLRFLQQTKHVATGGHRGEPVVSNWHLFAWKNVFDTSDWKLCIQVTIFNERPIHPSFLLKSCGCMASISPESR